MNVPQVTTASWDSSVGPLPEQIDGSKATPQVGATDLAEYNAICKRLEVEEEQKKALIPSSSYIFHPDLRRDPNKSLYPKTSTSSGIVSLVIRIEEIDLNDALRDLDEAREEAREEGFPQPSDVALENAGRLLREMYGISPRRFEVYPTPDGEIAIDAPHGQGRSVILLCDSEGGALCLVNVNGKHRRARYSTTETLPDGFMREALDDLKR